MDESLYKNLKAPTLKDEFVSHMEELILKDKLKPGERLPPERELARRFGVSRPLIHEGILTLENRGLVRLRPRHGVVVCDFRENGTLDLLLSLISNKEIGPGPRLTGELEQVRLLMEKDMVSRICRRRDSLSGDIKKLEQINRKMTRATGYEELAEQDYLFHLNLALASGNALYALLMNTLKPAHMELLGQFYRIQGNAGKAAEYHKLLISALTEQNEAKALELIARNDSYTGYDD
ncbi:MAG: GntR family transcriptional regulator [Spirochaetales bacterium]|nr:GntR family transcriptional regulator [Spirochaetales bacterium]